MSARDMARAITRATPPAPPWEIVEELVCVAGDLLELRERRRQSLLEDEHTDVPTETIGGSDALPPLQSPSRTTPRRAPVRGTLLLGGLAALFAGAILPRAFSSEAARAVEPLSGGRQTALRAAPLPVRSGLADDFSAPPQTTALHSSPLPAHSGPSATSAASPTALDAHALPRALDAHHASPRTRGTTPRPNVIASPSPETTSSSVVRCTPPFDIAPDGVRVYKPECL